MHHGVVFPQTEFGNRFHKRLFDHSQIFLFRRPTMLCGVEIANTLTSAAACTAARGKRPFGRGEWGGCETGPFPSFSRRGGCAINKKIPFLSGADGVVRNFKQNKDATRLY